MQAGNDGPGGPGGRAGGWATGGRADGDLILIWQLHRDRCRLPVLHNSLEITSQTHARNIHWYGTTKRERLGSAGLLVGVALQCDGM